MYCLCTSSIIWYLIKLFCFFFSQLWGIGKSGYRCKVCQIVCHKDCKDHVVMECRPQRSFSLNRGQYLCLAYLCTNLLNNLDDQDKIGGKCWKYFLLSFEKHTIWQEFWTLKEHMNTISIIGIISRLICISSLWKKRSCYCYIFFGTKIQFRVEFSPNDKQQYRRGGG